MIFTTHRIFKNISSNAETDKFLFAPSRQLATAFVERSQKVAYLFQKCLFHFML